MSLPESTPDLFSGFAGGISMLVAGPSGTGKSTLLGSAATLGRTVLLAAKPRERNSWKYVEVGLNKTAELFADLKWRPSMGTFEADGFVRLMRRIWALHEAPDVDIVLLDPVTDVVTLAAHELMKLERVATPRDLRDARGFYGALKYKLKEFTQALTALQYAAKPKHVLAAVHTQPASEEESERGKAVGFEGDVLPMIEGSYRQEIASEFDVVVFSGFKEEVVRQGGSVKRERRYFIQVTPSSERFAKIALGPMLTQAQIPNDFGALLKAIGGDK